MIQLPDSRASRPNAAITRTRTMPTTAMRARATMFAPASAAPARAVTTTVDVQERDAMRRQSYQRESLFAKLFE